MQVKAAYVHAPWRFELRDVALPEPAPGQILLDVEACGICGTDVHWASDRATFPQPFGHEICGIVAQVGEGVTAVAPGDRVALESSSFCGRCDTCRNGRVDLCAKAPTFWRSDGAMGFAERMLAPIECVVPAPDLEPESACLAEPVSVAQDLVRTSGAGWDDDVLLVGPGPIGLVATALLRSMGVRSLTVSTRNTATARSKLALELGADRVTDAAPGELSEKFSKILVTAPPQTIGGCVAAAAYGGSITYIGLDHGPGAKITLDADRFHFSKLQLRASHASPALWLPRSLDLIRRGVVPWRRLITHVETLEHIEGAVRTAATNRDTAVKVVVVP